MSKQHYFVVYHDTETNKFEIDWTRAEAVFQTDEVWDTDTEEWERADWDGSDNALPYKVSDKLTEILNNSEGVEL